MSEPVSRWGQFMDDVRTSANAPTPLEVRGTLTRLAGLVLEAVGSFGGSVSAEHGIGRAKTHFLELSRSPAEIAAMRSIKAALDPRGIMNPGVLLADRVGA